MSAYDAFATMVGAFAATRSLPVAYPGVPFTPPTSGEWLEVRWFPNEPVEYGTANDGPRLHRGFGQVSVCYRPGRGIAPGEALAADVIEAFGKGTDIGPVRVYKQPWQTGPLVQDERISHPVTIPWEGFGT